MSHPGGIGDPERDQPTVEVQQMEIQVPQHCPIVKDADDSRSFYASALGLAFEGQERDYEFTHELEGVKHFGLRPLSEAANACFGVRDCSWPPASPPVSGSLGRHPVSTPSDAGAGTSPQSGGRRDNQLMVTLGHGTQDEWR
jgi:catechol 2,3-dioxygenase-like lactoylglutathione lyase family enzyme